MGDGTLVSCYPDEHHIRYHQDAIALGPLHDILPLTKEGNRAKCLIIYSIPQEPKNQKQRGTLYTEFY